MAVVPIAVVGIGCRFPGADGPDQFWELLREGRDAVTEVPPDRFDVTAVYSARPATPGRVPSRAGGFLERIEEFDAAFFGIAPREAAHMDPQQRLLLEAGWEAVEDAGLVPGGSGGSPSRASAAGRAGVFIGQMNGNYWDLLRQARALDIYANIGNTRGALAGRLSYALDLRGPSITVDTACSSSLVAVHLAVQALRHGECEVALAGGVNVILHPDETITFAQARMIAPAGRCRFGAAGADGFVRSEGVGVVVLKPLEQAVADGDPVHAVIHGSAVGNDGQASGYLMTPSGEGQAETIRAAYAAAGVDPADVGYVEAHGTGSAAGDPAELAGLAEVFPGPLLVGSVKTNIGHTEAAAGMAGLIKAILCIRHREIPPSLHGPSAVDRDGLRVVDALTPWPSTGRAVAGVSSFGIAGTNAHVIVGEAPAPDPDSRGRSPAGDRASAPSGDRTPSEDRTPFEDDGPDEAAGDQAGPRLLVMSARTPAALRDLAAAYSAHPLTPLADVCHTAATRRRHHQSRLTVVGSSPAEIAGKLRAHVNGDAAPLLGTAHDVAVRPSKIVYIFPGQGSQWTGMGRELMATSPVFREAISECDKAVVAETGHSVLAAGDSDLGRIELVQPALWAIEVAIAALWRACGVEPDIVIGHSMGEVAAACVAGLLNVRDGAAVICRRSRLLAGVAGQGAMLSVELSEAGSLEEIARFADRVSVAVCSGPNSTVLSGDPAALDDIAARLDARGVFCRRVQVDVASHSPQMDPLLQPLREELRSLTPLPGSVPFRSTVLSGHTTELNGEYWARNLREPVRFADAVQAEAPAIFIEISPHPLLTGAIGEAAESAIAIPSLRRGEPERATLLDGLGALYRAGHPVSWERLHGRGRRAVPLPRYPWQRQRHWFQAPAPPPPTAAPKALSAAREIEHRVDEPYLLDHRVRGESVLPGTAYLWMAQSGAAGPAVLFDVRYREPFVLTADQSKRPGHSLRVSFHDDQFEIGSDGIVYATGRIAEPQAAGSDEPHGPSHWSSRWPPPESFREDLAAAGEHLTGLEFYARADADGNQWSGAFRGIAELWRKDGQAAGRISSPPGAPFPAVLDACCQVLSAAGRGGPFLLAGIEKVEVTGPLAGRPLWSHARAARGDGSLTGDLLITAEDGGTVAELTGVRLRYLDAREPAPPADWRYQLTWKPLSPAVPGNVLRNWAIFADASGVGTDVAARLRAAGHRCTTVTIGDHFERTLDGYRIDPASPGHHRKVLAESGATSAVHLWSLDADSALAALTSALPLAQAASETSLWFVTRTAQPVGGAPVTPDQAALWGFVRALAREHPECRATLIDLSGSGSEGLYAELTGDGDEKEVALRGGLRYAPRLVPARPQPPRTSPGLGSPPARLSPSPPVSPDGTYLISGGLGDLGQVMTRWLAEAGARHLLLLGRTPLSTHPLLEDLTRQGVQADYQAIDIADEDALRTLLRHRTSCGLPPVKGAIHAAGVVTFRPVADLLPEDLAAALHPKVNGGWTLHRVLRETPLDFFVLFSSGSAVLGSPMLAPYAAANAFLDALAHHARASGIPALTINWGFWTSTGMAARFEHEHGRPLIPEGMTGFSPSEGIAFLRTLMADNPVQALVLPTDWDRWAKAHPATARVPLLRELIPPASLPPASPPSSPAPGPLNGRTIQGYLLTEIADVLGLAVTGVNVDCPLKDQGMDSLMAVEVRTRVRRDLGVLLPVSRILSGATITDLAADLA